MPLLSIPSPLARRPGPATFARASTAYDPYTGVLSASGVPRFPIVGGVQGVMVEEVTTNVTLWSEQFDNADWNKRAGTSITANAGVSPRGDLTADLANWVSGDGYIWKTYQLTASTTYTVSCWAELVSGAPTIQFSLNGVGGGAFSSTATAIVAGWARYTFTVSIGAGTSLGDYGLKVIGGTAYIWGAQLEAKGYATAYQQTTSAAATRAAETLTIPTAGVLSPGQGWIIGLGYVAGDLASGFANNHYLFGCTTGTPYTKLIGIRLTAGTGKPLAFFAGTGQSITGGSALSVGWHTLGIRWSAAEVSLWVDGVKIANKLNPTMPGAIDPNIAIGNLSPNISDVSEWNNPIAGLDAGIILLSDSEMAAYTSGNPIPLTDKHTLKMTCPGAFVLKPRAASLLELSALGMLA